MKTTLAWWLKPGHHITPAHIYTPKPKSWAAVVDYFSSALERMVGGYVRPSPARYSYQPPYSYGVSTILGLKPTFIIRDEPMIDPAKWDACIEPTPTFTLTFPRIISPLERERFRLAWSRYYDRKLCR